jgi:hypothetical protein
LRKYWLSNFVEFNRSRHNIDNYPEGELKPGDAGGACKKLSQSPLWRRLEIGGDGPIVA